VLLPGCPLTDHYYIDYASSGAGPSTRAPGGAGLGATGGISGAAGASDAVGGDTAIGDSAGVGATNDDTAGMGDAAGGGAPVGGSGGMPALGGFAGTGGRPGMNGGRPGMDGGRPGVDGGRPGMDGGRPGTGGAMGGSPAAGAGGTMPLGGTAGDGSAASSGMPGMAGSSGTNQFQPLCDDTVVKGATCDASSVRFCYRTCGPDSVGYKSETCEHGAYTEQSGCTFPSSGDYSCYAVPARLPAQCPAATVPRASDPCQVTQCVVCFGGTLANPLYEDSTGTQKNGYCVCSDSGTWTCGSTSAWPCPGGSGCN
jgi:hypothetical protein